MPISGDLKRLFDAAQASYVAKSVAAGVLEADAIAKFQQFFNTINSQPAYVSFLETAFQDKILRSIIYRPKGDLLNPSGRSAYESPAYTLLGNSYLKGFKTLTKSSSGALVLSDDIIDFANRNVSPGSGALTSGQETSLFILAHELGHGYTSKLFAPIISEAGNAILKAVKLAPKDAVSIDVTDQVLDFVHAKQTAEGGATIFAYNTWVASLADPSLATNQDRLKAFGDYAPDLLNPDGSLIAGLTLDAGKIIVNVANADLLGQRDTAQDKLIAKVTGHVPASAVEGLAYAAAAKSKVTIAFDGARLGLTLPPSPGHAGTGFTTTQALQHFASYFWPAQRQELLDTSTGQKYLAAGKVDKNGTAANVSLQLVPATGYDPNNVNEVYVVLSNVDGDRVYDTSSLHFVRDANGSLHVTVTDADDNSVELTADEFERLFHRSAEAVFAEQTGQAPPSPDVIDPVSIKEEQDGTITISAVTRPHLFPGGVHLAVVNGRAVREDYLDREVTYVRQGDRIVAYTVQDHGVTVVTTLDEQQRPIATNIKINGNPIGVDFSDAGALLGQQLGTLLANGNQLTGVVASSVLRSIGDSLGDVVDGLVGRESVTHAIDDAFKTFGPELAANLKAAGVGAVSSYLTAELLRTVGIGGLPGQFGQSVSGAVVAQVVTNLTDLAAGVQFAADGSKLTAFSGVGPGLVVSAAASLIGTKLSGEIKTFESIGGQVGSSIGGAIAGIIDSPIVIAAVASGNPVAIAAVAVGVILDTIIGTLIGGLIGSVFGGIPRSGADVEWDSSTNSFAVTGVYSRFGGSKDVASGLGAAVSGTLNGIIAAVGGKLIDPGAVVGGNYGTYGRKLVYRPVSTRDEDAITERFTGKSATNDLINFGLYQAIVGSGFKIQGGDPYIKRALYATLDNASLNPGSFSAALAGNLSTAQRYESYLTNAATINSLIAAEPDSVFAAEWAITLAQAVELGLARRAASDWYGGFTEALRETGAAARDVDFGFNTAGSDDKPGRVTKFGDIFVDDTIDVNGQTSIQGTAGNDVIVIKGNAIIHNGSQSAGVSVDGIGIKVAQSTIAVAAVVDGGAGDDQIYGSDLGDNLSGGAGDDLLIGGKLDDWISGGDGNDVLDAGGGSGNVLSGGDGDDRLVGADTIVGDTTGIGSDWLLGGSGDDRLSGRGGDDYLDGGASNDRLDGGEGSDTFIYRSGDGHDQLNDSGVTTAQHDVLEFGDGIAASDITVVAHSSGVDLSLLVGSASSGDRIDLRGAVTNAVEGIEEVNFTNGSWSKTDLASRTVYAKTAGLAVVGTAADEALSGSVYDDTLTGGGGNDVLAGGDGSDVYTVLLNGGDVTIDDTGSAADVDVLAFGAGISRDMVAVTLGVAPGDIVIHLSATGQTITLKHQSLADGARSIEEVRFADGTSLTLRDLVQQYIVTSPTSGADTLTGFDGVDALYAGDGADIITGGAGDDDLVGGFGTDTYVYNIGDGNDRIYDSSMGGGGAVAYNTLQLGAGITAADLVLHRDAADSRNLLITFRNTSGSILIDDQFTISSYANNSVLNGITTIQFADGTTWDRATIDAQSIAQSISAGNDIVDGGTITATIATGAGNDVIRAGDGADIITGGAGDDDLVGGFGTDTYVYNIGDGNDRIYDGSMGGGGAVAYNTLQLGAGITAADLVLHRDAADSRNLLITFRNTSGSILVDDQFTTSSFAYNSVLNGITTIQFADGTTWDRATMDAAVQATTSFYAAPSGGPLTGDAGDNRVVGSDAADVLSGGGGVDRLEGGNGNDVYLFARGDGHVAVWDASGSNTVHFGAGIAASDIVLTRSVQDGDAAGVVLSIAGTDDRLYVIGQIDGPNHIGSFQFSDGTIWTEADLRARLYATERTAGADILQGSYAPDQLSGGAGDDRLYGDRGDDTLAGETGADRLEGGSGNDTYLFNRGDGFDTIWDESGSDTVSFGAGIAPTDLRLERSMQDGDAGGVVISIAGTDDRLYVSGQQWSDRRIERFVFADGTIWTDADLRTQLYAQESTEGADYIQGSDVNDIISGGAGDDELYGDRGDDTLSGGTGLDRLEGGVGNDIYIFNRGDGQDSIWDAGGDDTLRLGAGIGPDDIVLSRTLQDGDGRGLVIAIANTDDRIYLVGAQGAGQAVEHVEFADGTRWTLNELRAHLYAKEATAGADIIEGSDQQDSLYGAAGDDFLYGDSGDDTLDGGKGSDRLEGGGGNDSYLFGRFDGRDTILDVGGSDTVRFAPGVEAGDIAVAHALQDGDNGVVLSIKGTEDRLYIIGQQNGGTRVENFVFADGTTWTWQTVTDLLQANMLGGAQVASTMGDDTITGTAAGDILRGMGGDDVLRGGGGSDAYKFARGDGHDTIYDPTDAGATDTLVLEGINPGDVRVLVSPTDAEDLIIYLDDDSVIYLDQQRASASSGIEQVSFADGTVWDRATLLAKALNGVGTSGDDVLYGTNFADTLAGGAGNDTLAGGDGNDTYVYNLGDGDDTIIDDNGAGNDPRQTGSAGNVDILRFGAGITQADLRLTQRVADGGLVLSFASSAGSIALTGRDTGGRSGVQLVQFADGSSITIDALRASALSAAATTGNDVIHGFASADTLAGGAGNDELSGGKGADTYLFALGDGADTIVESADGSSNRLMLGAGITIADVRLVRTASAPGDLMVALSDGTDVVTIKDQFSNGGAAGIEEIHFADGATWLAKDIPAIMLAQPATANGDYLASDNSSRTIDGLAGDDLIIGGTGNDTLRGSDGNDTLYGGAGDDQLFGGAGDDILSGDTGKDLIDGGDGFDIADYSFSLDNWSINLTAGTAAIVTTGASDIVETITGIEGVIGGLGSDTIVGSDVANRLQGGGGNDSLSGAGGDDTFVVDGDEDGLDTIDGGSGFDRITAMSDGTVIGLAAVSGLELISGNGHTGVVIGASDESDSLDLTGVALEDIQSIVMGDGDDVLAGSTGGNVIDLGTGNDVLRYGAGMSGMDDVDGGDGGDRIEATADGTTIRLKRMVGVEAVSAAGFAGVVVERSDLNDTIDLNTVSYDGIARFDLGAGDDVFRGGNAADVVRGGAGDDNLAGGGGDDLFDYVADENGHDLVDGGAGYDTLRASSDDAVIGIASMTGIEAIDANGHSGVVLKLTDAADTLDLSGVAVTGYVGIVGGAGNDVLRGSASDDTFLVGTNDGFDNINGGAGNDTIQASADGAVVGVSALINIEKISAAGHVGVTVRTTDGADTLNLSGVLLEGIDRIDLGAGNDVFDGSAGNDVIVGGVGDDHLSGGAGNDTYRFNLGDGHDIISEQGAVSGGGFDVLQFGEGISASDVQVTTTNNGADFVFSIGDGSDTVQVVNGASASENYWLEEVHFADGTVWTRDSLAGAVVPYTNGDDRIYGTSDPDTLRGGGGNDWINGRGGNDIIIGGTGNDTVGGGSGDDTYRFNRGDGQDTILDGIDYWDGGNGGFDTIELGAGILTSDVTVTQQNNGHDFRLDLGLGDSIYIGNSPITDGGNVIEQVKFADGTVWTAADLFNKSVAPTSSADHFAGTYGNDALSGGTGNDWINGRGGNDIIVGGTGNDTVGGGSGDDTYRFNRGDGQDTILDGIDYWDGGNGGFDTIELGAGILTSDVTVTQQNNGHDFRLDLGSGDSIYIGNNPITDGGNVIEQVKFADGTVWTAADLFNKSIAPSSGADHFAGTYGNDTLSGAAGADWINGRGGNDIIVGGTGNDTVGGGSGDDTYRFNRGDGQDTVLDGIDYWDGGNGGFDTIELGAGILTSDVTVTQQNNGHDFLLDLGQGDSIYIGNNPITDGGNIIEQVKFADGTVWTAADLFNKSVAPTSGADHFAGTYGNDAISGGAGADWINGRGGNDIIVGGTGNDTVGGGSGDDTYRFNRGDGQDTILDGIDYWDGGNGGFDTIELGAGIIPDEVLVSRQGNDFLLDFGQGDSIHIGNSPITDGGNAIEQVKFADGTIWTQAQLLLLSSATDNADTLNGTDSADWIRGRNGDDHIDGAGGDDHLLGQAGNDQINGDDGNDVLAGGAQSDTLTGGAGNDLLIGDNESGSFDGAVSYIPTGPNLVINGSFEDFGNTATYYNWGANIATMPGWTKSTPAQYEAAHRVATDGSWGIDLEAYYENMDISQSVTGLTGGAVYQLQFDSFNIGSGDNGFQLYWDGQLVDAVTRVSSSITTYSYSLVANGTSDTLRFVSTGPVDNDGASLDNVRLRATVNGGPEGWNDVLAGSAGDDILVGGTGSDTLDGGDGDDTAVFSGSLADYQLSTADGVLTVTDLNPGIDGDDGTDQLVGIETLRFQDQSVSALDVDDMVGSASSTPRQSELYSVIPASSAADEPSSRQNPSDGFRMLFDEPRMFASIDSLKEDSNLAVSPNVQQRASELAQSMAAFGQVVSGQADRNVDRESALRDFWFAHHKSVVGPQMPAMLAA